MSAAPLRSATVARDLPFAPGEAHDRWFLDEVYPHGSGLRKWLRTRFPWLHDIDDLVQESYARILQARRQGRVGHAKSYLFTTARNAAFDQARRTQAVPIDCPGEIAELPVSAEGPDAAERLAHDEELAVLADAIEALPHRCRLVVKLRKLRGLSYQEIGDQLGISVHTVNAQLAKGITLCRAYLRERGVEKHEG